jgi:hypothetical protein
MSPTYYDAHNDVWEIIRLWLSDYGARHPFTLQKKVLEKFATTLLECTLRVDIRIGKIYKVEVTDDGFTVRK